MVFQRYRHRGPRDGRIPAGHPLGGGSPGNKRGSVPPQRKREENQEEEDDDKKKTTTRSRASRSVRCGGSEVLLALFYSPLRCNISTFLRVFA